MVLEQRQLVECVLDGEKLELVRHLSIVYNEAYNTPQLFFNFYRADGHIVLLEQLRCMLSSCSAVSGTEFWAWVSQNEHPLHGIAFFNVHPCRTAQFMRELSEQMNIDKYVDR